MKNIERMFLNHEFSSILNKLGYKNDTFYYWFPNPNINVKTFSLVRRDYYVGHETLPLHSFVNEGVFTKTIPAPTFQEAIDWLREIMRVRVDIQSKTSGKTGYNLWMWDTDRVCWVHVYYREPKIDELTGKVKVDGAIVEGSTFVSVMDYYEACEMAIIESLKIVGLLVDGKKISE